MIVVAIIAVLILTAIIAYFADQAGQRATAERNRLIAIIVAQDVSPQAAVSVAKGAISEPQAAPKPRIPAIGL